MGVEDFMPVLHGPSSTSRGSTRGTSQGVPLHEGRGHLEQCRTPSGRPAAAFYNAPAVLGSPNKAVTTRSPQDTQWVPSTDFLGRWGGGSAQERQSHCAGQS